MRVFLSRRHPPVVSVGDPDPIPTRINIVFAVAHWTKARIWVNDRGDGRRANRSTQQHVGVLTNKWESVSHSKPYFHEYFKLNLMDSAVTYTHLVNINVEHLRDFIQHVLGDSSVEKSHPFEALNRTLPHIQC